MAYAGAPNRTAVDANFDTTYVAPSRVSVGHNFVQSGPQGRAAVESPLRAAAGVASVVGAARAAAGSPLGVALVYSADGTKEASASAPSPLRAAAARAEHVAAARATMHSPLGAAEVLGSDTTVPARASARSPLGAGLVEAWHLVGARPAIGTPLGSAQPVSRLVTHGRSSVRSPLGPEAVEGYQPPAARVGARTPLGAPAVRTENRLAQASAPSPLTAAAVRVWHDFSVAIGPDVPIYYVCDVVAGETRRMAISSWQATIQAERQSYLQVVVPAALEYADFLTGALAFEGAEIVVSRVARLADGAVIEKEMARAALQSGQIARGASRMTATLSGYADGFVLAGDPPSATDRALQQVRSINTGQGGPRVRCAIDWLLEPGLRAVYGEGDSFVTDWINYYVTGRDAYMDVGSRVS